MGLFEAGKWGQLVGSLLMAVGAFFPPLIPIGAGIMVLSTVAMAIDMPKPPDGSRHGTHFSFNQYQNPVIGDSVIPVVYGRHRVAPIIAMAYLSPLDSKGNFADSRQSIEYEDMGLTVMALLCEGPIPKDGLEQLYINDEEVWTDVTQEKVGVGDGSKTQFKLPRKNVDLNTLEIWVNGVKKSAVQTGSRTNLVIGKAHYDPYPTLERRFTHTETVENARIDYGSLVVHQPEGMAVWPYTVDVDSDRKFTVEFGVSLMIGRVCKVNYDYWYTDESIKSITQSDGDTTITFKTAPTNGHVIKWTGRASKFDDLEVDFRVGDVDQPPVDSIAEVRNSHAVTKELSYDTSTTYLVPVEADDISVTIGCLTGLLKIGKSDGERSSRSVEFTIDYRKYGETTWIPLPYLGKDGGHVFELKAKTENYIAIEISIKKTLTAALKAGRIKQADYDYFVRDQYELQIIRKNEALSETKNNVRDRAWLHYVTTVQEERLSYPGTAYVVLRLPASAKVAGSFPAIGALIKGRIVKNLTTGVKEWSQNPAWCMVDWAVSSRYGACADDDDIVEANWKTFAAFCDANLRISNAKTITRCQLNAVIDKQRDPFDWMSELLFPHWGIPVKRGKLWDVIIDQARDSDKTYYCEGALSNQLQDALKVSMEELLKTPTELDVSFNDEDENYELSTLFIPPDTWPEERRKKSISMYGCTRREQVIVRGKDALRALQLESFIVETTAFPDGALSSAGDVVTVKSAVAGHSTGTDYRVLRVTVMASGLVKLTLRLYSAARYAALTSGNPTAPAAAVTTEKQGLNSSVGAGSSSASSTSQASSSKNFAWKKVPFTAKEKKSLNPQS